MSMSDERLSLPNETDLQTGALLPANALPQGNGEWGGIALKDAGFEPAKPDLTIYLHAIRRHWVMASAIGLLCAGIFGPAVYLLIGDQYTAISRLQVLMNREDILPSAAAGTVMDRERFEIFKNTQQELLLRRTVLLKALHDKNVTDIPIVQYKSQYADAVEWLASKLSVSFPQKAEVMAVSLSLDNPKESQALVKAVVEAYMSEVVENDNSRRQKRFSELETLCNDKEAEARGKREQLRGLVASTGGQEAPELLSTKQKLLLDELQIYRAEMAKNQFEIVKAKGELAAQKALLENIAEVDVPQMEIDQMIQNDPVARQLSIELGWKKIDEGLTKQAIKPGVASGYATQATQQVAALQQSYDERINLIEQKARQKKKSMIETEIIKVEMLLKPLEKEQSDMANKSKELLAEAKKIGLTNVDIQMIQADLKVMDQVMANFTSERERLRAEIRSTPRIFVLEPAQEPLMPSNTTARMALTCLAILASLCCPVAAIVFLDTRTQRINKAADVSDGLRLPVIGSMPLVPARVIRHLGSPSPRNRIWHLRLTESVDGIAARLLRKADLGQVRVVMVSSATGGEGKTTLATQLALSLARSGRRTVLVDFDLRRPSFDEMFGVPLSPGVSESLRQESGAVDVVHATSTDNLCVVAAGRWDRQTLASLSNGGVDLLFKQLREEFEFVVVDTSPILPVADARFVSQFVDTVVLSVFRDVSEAPKIQAACDILAAFGAQAVEAVVTGQNSNLYGRHMGYESTVSA
jgi:polysaccharide biosynthesis transport protein